MRNRTLDVIAIKPLVKVDRGSKGFNEGIGPPQGFVEELSSVMSVITGMSVVAQYNQSGAPCHVHARVAGLIT
jgi:hypothetical protein